MTLKHTSLIPAAKLTEVLVSLSLSLSLPYLLFFLFLCICLCSLPTSWSFLFERVLYSNCDLTPIWSSQRSFISKRDELVEALEKLRHLPFWLIKNGHSLDPLCGDDNDTVLNPYEFITSTVVDFFLFLSLIARLPPTVGQCASEVVKEYNFLIMLLLLPSGT